MKMRTFAAAVVLSGAPLAALAQELPYEIRVCSTTETSVIDKAGDVTIVSSVSRGMANAVAAGVLRDVLTPAVTQR